MRLLLLAVLVGCGAVGQDGDPGVECTKACPDGTRRTSYDAVVSGEGFTVAGDMCETACEPTLTCLAPNIPTVFRDDAGVDHYECKLLDGLSSIPEDVTVDFTFATVWSDDAAQP